jgi:hypothetical protein
MSIMMEFTKKEKVIVMIAIVTVAVAIVTALAVGIEYGKQQVQLQDPHLVMVVDEKTVGGEVVKEREVPLSLGTTTITMDTQNPHEKAHNVTRFSVRVYDAEDSRGTR